MTAWLLTGHRGGVGRSTVALELGAALAKAKEDVLLIDLDPARPLAHRLGLTLGEPFERTRVRGPLQVAAAADLESLPGLVLETGSTFDTVIIDGPAGIALEHPEMLDLVDHVFVHLRADPLSWRTLPAFLDDLEAELEARPKCALAGLLTGAPPGEDMDGEWMEVIRERLESHSFWPALPWCPTVPQAEAMQRILSAASKDSPYTRAMHSLAMRLRSGELSPRA